MSNGSNNASQIAFITDQLAQTSASMRIGSWHKNQSDIQVGGKSDEVGWELYEACREGGAIIATAHEHSFSRTHLLDHFETQSIADTSNSIRIEKGKTFAFDMTPNCSPCNRLAFGDWQHRSPLLWSDNRRRYHRAKS